MFLNNHQARIKTEVNIKVLELPLTLRRRIAQRTAIQNPAARLPLVLIFLLALPPLWLSLIAAPALRVDVGMWGDHTFLSGVNAIEHGSGED